MFNAYGYLFRYTLCLGILFCTCRFLEIKTNYCALTVTYDSMFEDVLIINLLVICCRDIILPFIGFTMVFRIVAFIFQRTKYTS